jgi:hypothetical protein
MATVQSPAIRVQRSSQRRARPRPDHSELTEVQPSHIAPWLFAALERIHEIEKSPRNYPGMADLTVTQETARYARSVLGSLFSLDLPGPTVAALSGGALGIAWSIGTRELEAVIYPGYETSFVVSVGDQVIEDDTFQGNNTASLEIALIQLLKA